MDTKPILDRLANSHLKTMKHKPATAAKFDQPILKKKVSASSVFQFLKGLFEPKSVINKRRKRFISRYSFRNHPKSEFTGVSRRAFTNIKRAKI